MTSPSATSFPRKKIRVVLLEGVHDAGVNFITDRGFAVDTHAGSLEGPALLSAVRDARVLGIRSKTQITEEVLDAAPKLMAIGAFCIGTNQIDLSAAAKRGIPVFNAPFGNTRSVAELTIAEAVMLSRRVMERSSQMHAGTWKKSASGSHEIRGKTIGIVGYGHIGMQVSVLAEAMGMRVVYFDVASKLGLGNARAVDSLDALLRESDVVTLHVPATPGTECLIGARELGLMKPGSVLINNARGTVVDVPALAASLKEGHLAGAAVDVFPEEPATNAEPFESELRGLPNVILTPHIAGSTQEAQSNIAIDVAVKMTRYIDTGATGGAVNVPEVDLPEQPGVGGRRAHRILNFHRNEPGFLSALNGVIAGVGANVAGQSLQTLGQIGYVVLDVDPTDGEAIRAGLEALPGSIRTRILW